MSTPRQGEIWWAETEVARRPVLVVTRSEAAAVLKGSPCRVILVSAGWNGRFPG